MKQLSQSANASRLAIIKKPFPVIYRKGLLVYKSLNEENRDFA